MEVVDRRAHYGARRAQWHSVPGIPCAPQRGHFSSQMTGPDLISEVQAPRSQKAFTWFTIAACWSPTLDCASTGTKH